MTWRVVYAPPAAKDLTKLDPQIARRIIKFINERIVPIRDPRSIGEALHGPVAKYWKYRVGDYRLICEIQDKIITIIIVRVGNRREVYR
ncbi:MAG: type II toxin-antitoxin system RelE family toxin [Burkholderiales bacterium]